MNETDVLDDDRLASAEAQPEDEAVEAAQDPALRPKSFADFVGQGEAVEHLKVFIAAAKKRGETLDHVLFSGPPGLGKTTLAQIIAGELGYRLVQASAPAIQKPGDIVSILLSLDPWSVLFLDEVHRLNKTAAEHLYTAMEDRRLSLVVGDGPAARNMTVDLSPFTLVGATTQPGRLPPPFLHRFGIQQRLEFYDPADLARIIRRAADLLKVDADDEALLEIANRSRGTPRIAKRLLKRVRDFADEGAKRVDRALTVEALARLHIEEDGLDRHDRRYLETLARSFGGGPVGLDTLAAALDEDPDILEAATEPHLMRLGFIQRTLRGRQITDPGFARISRLRGRPMPQPASGPAAQSALPLDAKG